MSNDIAIKSVLLKQAIREDSVPKYLHKFRAIDSFTEDSFTEDILLNNQLWFAQHETFNDPFDCQIHLSPNTTKEDIISFLQTGGIELTKEYTTESLSEMFDRVIRDNINQKGICCFSKNYSSILQWSHYANSHKGICLVFDIEKDYHFFAEQLHKVKYVKEYPDYNPLKHYQTSSELLMATKYIDWKYEEEIRIIKDSNKSYQFSPSSLKEIIFGNRTSDNDIEKIKRLISVKQYQHVILSRAKIMKRQFKITKETL